MFRVFCFQSECENKALFIFIHIKALQELKILTFEGLLY